MLKTNKFKQLINTPTRETKSSSSLIDHIWTNSSGKVSQSGVIESGVSDHFIIFCTRKITREHIGKHNNINIRSLKNYDQDTFRENLRGTDWSPVTSSFDSNVIWEIFSTIFNQKIDEVAPPKESRIKNRTEPWINNEILELMRERDKVLYHSNRNKANTELRENFNKLRNEVINKCRQAKNSYFSNKIEEHKDNSNQLWKHLKKLGYSHKSKGNSNIVLDINNEKCYDSKTIVEHINDFYINVAAKLVSKLPIIPKVYDVSSQLFKNYYYSKNIVPKSKKITPVTEAFVLKELLNLNPNKSTGIDNIQAKFLKDGAHEIKGVITHIINVSIVTNTVPDELKFAKVKPLFKKNSRLDVGNYRPVSILCIVSKILERAVLVQIEKHLNENNLLYANQSGFRKSYSTDTCLISLMDHIRMEISQGNYVGMVLLDLQKAFDTVDHDILCNKLEAMGIDFTEWFKSYLGGRKQIVIANGVSSEPKTVKCGVPQGSILGPLLFLCYVNDMPISLTCKLLLYADDSALIVSGPDPDVIAETLSNELKSCRQWLIDNKLSLHLGKTEAILFGTKRKLRRVDTFAVKCDDEIIQNVKSVKYLGIQLDEDLAGESIVKEIIKKANSRLKFLYRCKDMLNLNTRKILCTALIQCHFDYSCSSWFSGVNKTLRKKLQIMQNKMVRFTLNLRRRDSVRNKEFLKVDALNVSDRVKQLKMNHVFKIRNQTSPSYMLSHFNRLNVNSNRMTTRASATDFFVPRVSGQGANTFFFTAIKEWNSLSTELKNINCENRFKEKLKQELMEVAKKREDDEFERNV